MSSQNEGTYLCVLHCRKYISISMNKRSIFYIICHNACTRQAYYSENTDVTDILSFYRGTMKCFFICNALIKHAQIHVKTPGMHPNVMRTYSEAMHGCLTGFLR